jgi:hypothetical protein
VNAVGDERWVLDPPSSKYLSEGATVAEEELQAGLEGNIQQMIEEEFTAVSDTEMRGPKVVAGPVGTFLTELKKSGDVQHHPLAWALALLVVAPGVILGVQNIQNGADFASTIGLKDETLALAAGMLFDFLVIGQLVIGPGACSAFARRRHLGPAVFVAMGSSAVLMVNNQVVRELARAFDVIAVIICIVCIAPLVIVLRNKRVQLPPGRARHTWAFLMSVSILMFASATMVAAILGINPPLVSTTVAWSSLLLVAGVIGWAWPKGREVIEEVAEEIIERAL